MPINERYPIGEQKFAGTRLLEFGSLCAYRLAFDRNDEVLMKSQVCLKSIVATSYRSESESKMQTSVKETEMNTNLVPHAVYARGRFDTFQESDSLVTPIQTNEGAQFVIVCFGIGHPTTLQRTAARRGSWAKYDIPKQKRRKDLANNSE